jgi:hypothetical protein
MPAPLCQVDVVQLASATSGCTGADLKAIIDDGKLLFARDQIRGKHKARPEAYFLDAIAAVRDNRRKYRKRRPAITDAQAVGFVAG